MKSSIKKLLAAVFVILSSSFLFAEDWYICLNSFKDQENATQYIQYLTEHEIPGFIGLAEVKGSSVYRVFYDKKFASKAESIEIREQLATIDALKSNASQLWTTTFKGVKIPCIVVSTGTPVIKEVVKEVPVVKEVEVVKEIVKEVPVVKEVEVVKEVVKEVPVEVVREVVKEVPVEVVKEVPVAVPAANVVIPEPEVEPEPAPVVIPPVVKKEVLPPNPEKQYILVKNSESGKAVEGAKVVIDESIELVTNKEGRVDLPKDIKDGNHKIEISKEQYVTTKLAFNTVNTEITTASQFSIPPMVDYNRIKIILDWGYNPADLDAHVVCGPDHVYYRNENAGKIHLDRDDKTHYGPETITIEDVDDTKVYSYYVTLFDDKKTSKDRTIATSPEIQVTVFINNDDFASYQPPADGVGWNWHVFDICDGVIEPVNEITASSVEARKK